MKSFQEKNNVPATGKLDEQTLADLGIGTPSTTGRSVSKKQNSDPSKSSSMSSGGQQNNASAEHDGAGSLHGLLRIEKMGGLQSDEQAGRRRSWILRHSAIVRVTHWINFLCLAVLLMSGLQIFNAHSALYWGQASDFPHPLLAMDARPDQQGALRGVTTVLGHDFDTTGVLGLSYVPGFGERERGFPAWATLPGMQWLAMGRRWHFFFAWIFIINGLVYLTSGLASGHFRRDLLPTGEQLRHIGGAIWDHLRLRFPKGEEARRYNVLQKLAYLAVVFLILPAIALAGMTMSPNLDSIAPQLVILFGGRQSARTIHFLLAAALVTFFLVHVLMVLLSGVWNNMRSMTSGWYRIEHTEDVDDRTA